MQISVRQAQDKLSVAVDKRPEDSLAFIAAMRELAATCRALALAESAEINRKMYGFADNREIKEG